MGTSLSVDENNRNVLRDLKKGDLVEISRKFYSHWAVYVGDRHVVHLTGVEPLPLKINNPGDVFKIGGEIFRKAVVKRDIFLDVAKGSWAKINNEKDERFVPKSPQEIVNTANEKIGVIGYNLLWNNCESFASFCRYGNGHTDQGVMVWESGFNIVKYIIGRLHEPNSKKTRITRIYSSNNQQEEPNKLSTRHSLKIYDARRAFLNMKL